MSKNKPYNYGNACVKEFPLARKTPPSLPGGETFSQRLAHLRKAAGYSQYTLADAMGITQRMIAHYENSNGNPPLYLLPKFSRALGVSVDQLLGMKEVKEIKKKDSRLWQRFAQAEKLPPKQRKKIVDLLDAFLGKF